MKPIPYLKQEKKKTTLYVEDKPFLILGGELHNSSGSDLDYMEEKVWPGLRRLGGNCYLTPVYWECMEPEPDIYDFTLVDGVIAQARREGVHLILLWFGLWKNGASSYVPVWMKKDDSFFYMRDVNSKMAESVSPFCEEAVKLDQRAFTALMEHLKKVDEERTVLMVQVENEIGFWGSPRDYGEKADALFKSEIPEEMKKLFGAKGSWEEAFGLNACDYFMAWAFSKAVGKIAASGKKAYGLPLFMNSVAIGLPLRAGEVPSGGPLPRVHKIWRAFAPEIDLYGPDIYSPFYKEVSSEFAAVNALMVPELSQDKDAPSKALYTVAAFNTICFSPFGIDGMMTPLSENDLLSQTNTDSVGIDEKAGENLSKAYGLLHLLWPEIREAQERGDVYAFLQQPNSGEAEFVLDDYLIRITYGDGGMPGHSGQPGRRREGGPAGGGFVLRRDRDRFLVCGIACNIQVNSGYASEEQVFVLEKKELNYSPEGLKKGRILNGDERNFMAIGTSPEVLELTFYRRGRK